MAPIIQTCSFALIVALAAPALAQSRPGEKPSAFRSYAMARSAQEQGEDALALARYAEVLAQEVGNKPIAFRVMREAVRQGDMRLALRAAYQLGPASELTPDALLLLIADKIRLGDLRAIGPMLDALEGNDTFKFMSPLIRSWAAVSTRGGAPVAMIDQISRRSTASYYAPEMRGFLLLASGRDTEGLTYVRSLALGNNSTPALRLSTASFLVKKGRRDEALGILGLLQSDLNGARALIEKGKGAALPPMVRTPAQGTAQLLSRIAGDLIDQKASNYALLFARYARFLDPVNPLVALTEARAMALAKLDEKASQAMAQLSNDAVVGRQAREVQVGLLEELSKDDEALALAKSLSEAPEAALADHIRFADAQARAGKYTDAAASYDRIIKMVETSGGAELWLLWYSRGSALDRAGQWPNARAALEKAVALAPNQPGPLNQLGYSLLERRENLPQALELLKKAHELSPDDNAITDSYGWALYHNGRYDEAIDTLELAVRSDPFEPTLGEHLGDAYWAAGRRLDARYAWRAAAIQAEGDVAARLNQKIDFGISQMIARAN